MKEEKEQKKQHLRIHNKINNNKKKCYIHVY